MKRFAALMLILSLATFGFACAKKAEKPAGDTEAQVEAPADDAGSAEKTEEKAE
jgi:hypothetical protein